MTSKATDKVKPVKQLSYCSPSHSNNDGTCFSDNGLVKLAQSYNNTHKDKIAFPSIQPNTGRLSSDKRKAIWKSLMDKLKANNELPCTDDYCVLYTDVAEAVNDREIHEETFRPERPENWYDNPNEWLTNIDIEDVMRQYEKIYPDFKFLGPTPIDFDTKLGSGNSCVESSICNLSLRQMLQQGKRRIGIVFNLDPHYKSGSHWTALMCDINAGGIYYFDSYGMEPPKEARVLMARLRSQGNQLIEEGLLRASHMKPIHIHPLDGQLVGAGEFQLINNSDVRTGGTMGKPQRTKKVQSGDICHMMDESGKIVGGTQMRVRDVKPDNVIVFNKEIPREWKTRVQNGKAKVVRKDFEEMYNNTRFQYGNSECGMFSMYFIVQFLDNKNVYDVMGNRVNDDFVWKKRDEYFRPNVKRVPSIISGKEGSNVDKNAILAALIKGGKKVARQSRQRGGSTKKRTSRKN